MPTPKHIRAFELRLRANWSSEDVVTMLTPDFVETVLLHGFAALEPTIKMRALIAFLGARAEHLASMRHLLPPLLKIADGDKDEWVQVVSGLVRGKLLLSEEESSADIGENPTATQSDFVLRKTVREVLEQAKHNMSERSGSKEQRALDGSSGSSEARHMREAPYFGPLEERYVSRRQQPRKQEFTNAHFSVKYDFVSEFSEDLASNVSGAQNSSLSPTGGAAAGAVAFSSRAGQGGLVKAGSLVPKPSPAAPNLAQARRVSLAAAVDPSAGSDGLRRISKPLALSRNFLGTQAGVGRVTSGVGGARGVRGGGGGGGGSSKTGLMMINVDELQAIHAEKQSARERAKGKPGRKKAKVGGSDEQNAPVTDPSSVAAATEEHAQLASSKLHIGDADGLQPEKPSSDEKVAETKLLAKSSAPTDVPMPIPQQGEIEAVAAMMVLGVAGGEEDSETSYLPEALTKLLENSNSLRSEGKAKLESFFQKKTPGGSPQERIKYHEEVSPGADGEMMRVTSYIRLDYETWVWDRVHKKKRVKS
ncbi:unnamed protein product [Hapterophycus canaliculatus]